VVMLISTILIGLYPSPFVDIIEKSVAALG
jgi:NADH:ubiquinone oxidoreductase subunit 4 (subunit M)